MVTWEWDARERTPRFGRGGDGMNGRRRWGLVGLVLFTIRHLLGIGLVGYLALLARRIEDGDILWVLLTAFTLLYAATATWAWTRYYHMYRRSRR